MDQESIHMVVASKVHMLKPGEYELWRMRMEQYIQMVDYSLWEVIENSNASPITKLVKGVKTIIAPATAEEKAPRRLELKARSTLLMGIPNEHQLKFNYIKDAKSLLKALEIHGETISQEDVNQKFLRSLSLEWNTHTIVWRNKPEIDTLSLDGLYNNLKIYEQEVKGTSSSSTNTQNIAFVSSNSTSSTNGAVTTALGATTTSTQATAVNSTTIDNLSDVVIFSFFATQPNSPQLNNKDLQQIHPNDLEEIDLRWKMAMLTMRAIILEIFGTDTLWIGTVTFGFELVQVECSTSHQKGHFARESGLVSFTIARPVNTAQPKTTVNSARPMTNVFNTSHSTVRRPINNKTAIKNSNFNQRVNTVSGKNVNTSRPKAVVNATRPKAVLNAVKGNQVNVVKASDCWVWKPKTKVTDHVSKHNNASTILKRAIHSKIRRRKE
ncbi:hypothetical protein Tco_1017865 [Tanacetum coccineum]|uniref:Uncharacterized protein n=1 Tax=Tanacetum coccineum TaxID=301880 RepID=A0ABQ5FSW3_9ASTR